MISILLLLIGLTVFVDGSIKGLTYPFPNTGNQVWWGVAIMGVGAIYGIYRMMKENN